ncbi:MAG: hypothetical protein HQK53_05940 [Oligoflexia bacterium]|nr:hypothetical protein [Oligoflexia bacterium]
MTLLLFKKPASLLLFLLIVAIFTGCHPTPGNIPLMGVDSKGGEVVEYLPKRIPYSKVHKVIDNMNSYTLAEVSKAAVRNPHWRLEKLHLGITLEGKAGFLNLGVSGNSYLCLIFKRG